MQDEYDWHAEEGHLELEWDLKDEEILKRRRVYEEKHVGSNHSAEWNQEDKELSLYRAGRLYDAPVS